MSASRAWKTSALTLPAGRRSPSPPRRGRGRRARRAGARRAGRRAAAQVAEQRAQVLALLDVRGEVLSRRDGVRRTAPASSRRARSTTSSGCERPCRARRAPPSGLVGAERPIGRERTCAGRRPRRRARARACAARTTAAPDGGARRAPRTPPRRRVPPPVRAARPTCRHATETHEPARSWSTFRPTRRVCVRLKRRHVRTFSTRSTRCVGTPSSPALVATAIPGSALAAGASRADAAEGTSLQGREARHGHAAVQEDVRREEHGEGDEHCVAQREPAADEDAKNAAQECKTERDADPAAFTEKYGTNKNKKNAYGKCVSGKAEDATEEETEARVNAAQTCKAMRADDKAAFEEEYGTKKNAFGKCVSATAKARATTRSAGSSSGHAAGVLHARPTDRRRQQRDGQPARRLVARPRRRGRGGSSTQIGDWAKEDVLVVFDGRAPGEFPAPAARRGPVRRARRPGRRRRRDRRARGGGRRAGDAARRHVRRRLAGRVRAHGAG